MSDRKKLNEIGIDELIDIAAGQNAPEGMAALASFALVRAQQELVEQQKIANRIAYAQLLLAETHAPVITHPTDNVIELLAVLGVVQDEIEDRLGLKAGI